MRLNSVTQSSNAKPNGSAEPVNNDAARALEDLVSEAQKANASDVHLQMMRDRAEITFRLDGVMTRIRELEPTLAERVFGRIKFLAQLKTYQESLPQDGRIDRDVVGAASDLRVATYPTVTGEKIVVRLFHPSTVASLSELQFPELIQLELKRFLHQTSGLLLLTGPSGSGKTTTIYACLRELAAAGGRHVITVEDPAEQIIPGIMQTEVSDARGLDFAKAARHLLRQDPQVLVIGEIRDDETAAICVRAALTGHLVISTLHAGSCKGVFERLLTLCPDASSVAAAVELVLNQRLVRRVCPACSGKGCPECFSTGYRGRLPIVELLRVTDETRRNIASRTLEKLPAQSSLADEASKLTLTGVTTPHEIARVLGTSA